MTLRTRVSSRAYACVLSALLAMAGAAVPARADVLTVTASGTIGSSCGLTSASPVGSPNLSASGSVGATVTVNCNTGFRLNALSAQGAIKSATSAAGQFQQQRCPTTSPFPSRSKPAVRPARPARRARSPRVNRAARFRPGTRQAFRRAARRPSTRRRRSRSPIRCRRFPRGSSRARTPIPSRLRSRWRHEPPDLHRTASLPLGADCPGHRRVSPSSW